MVEQKRRNKNHSLFQVTQTKIGDDSASAKRSAEQKLVSGTKTVEQKLVGGTKKRSAEQTKGQQNKNW